MEIQISHQFNHININILVYIYIYIYISIHRLIVFTVHWWRETHPASWSHQAKRQHQQTSQGTAPNLGKAQSPTISFHWILWGFAERWKLKVVYRLDFVHPKDCEGAANGARSILAPFTWSAWQTGKSRQLGLLWKPGYLKIRVCIYIYIERERASLHLHQIRWFLIIFHTKWP